MEALEHQCPHSPRRMSPHAAGLLSRMSNNVYETPKAVLGRQEICCHCQHQQKAAVHHLMTWCAPKYQILRYVAIKTPHDEWIQPGTLVTSDTGLIRVVIKENGGFQYLSSSLWESTVMFSNNSCLSKSKSFNFLNYANQIININKSKFENRPQQHVADTVNASRSTTRACLTLQLPVCHPAFNCKKCLLIFNQMEGILGSIYSIPQFFRGNFKYKTTYTLSVVLWIWWSSCSVTDHL